MTDLVDEAWAALVAGSAVPPSRADVRVTGASGHLPSALAVEDTAVACVTTALLAAAALGAERGGRPAGGEVVVDRGHVAAAVRSERYFHRPGQREAMSFAPLSRFWLTADGWLRTHANYRWHRRALLQVLGVDEDAGAVAVAAAAALASASAADIEDRVFAAGGVAAALRTVDEWRAHPQGRAVAAEPLVGHDRFGDTEPRRLPPLATGDLPAAGVRVVDLTRVIAGPVCTRFLGALGADVLRLDPPDHPDMPAGALGDTLLGKRSAFLDLSGDAGGAALHELLDETDVVVCGYRPGSLDRFGLAPDALTERHPGIVAVHLAAWGHTGPWSGRRGFDSVVQGPSGIAWAESAGGEQPGALPCQLLDHGTGYLAAAAVLDGLRRQALEGGTHGRRLSLARTAAWLTSTPPPRSTPPPAEPEHPPWLVELDAGAEHITAVAPPGRLAGADLHWPGPPAAYGSDRPTWNEARL